MDRVAFLGLDGSTLIDRVSRNVEDAAHHAFPDRHVDRYVGIGHFQPPLESLGAGHGDSANPLLAKMLLHFESEAGRLTLDLEVNREGVVDSRKLVRKLDIDYRTDHLNNFASIHIWL